MAMPTGQRVTTTESMKGMSQRCDFCGERARALQRDLNNKWVCSDCDPGLDDLIVVVRDEEAAPESAK